MLAGADIWINGGTRNPGFDRIPRNFIFLGVGTVFVFFFLPLLVGILMADVGRKVSLAWVAGAAAFGREQNCVFRAGYLLLLRLAAETSAGSCGPTITRRASGGRAQRRNAASDETFVEKEQSENF